MKNHDVLQLKKAEIMNKMNQAMKDDNEEAFAAAFNDFTEMLQTAVMEEANGLIQAADTNVLNGRGVRQLTSEENTYYQKVIDAMKTSNPKQALSDVDVVLPKTVIDAVFEDLVDMHPLLDAINFQNTSGLIEFLVNTQGTELAVWGTLTATITKELTSGFKKVNLTLNKMSAFLPVAKSMLDLGPIWMDRYVRAILYEAIANGLEAAIVNGTGKDQPIGMNRQVGAGVVV
ncbi:MAG: phage major capsid protein, partial [Clostridia bacterium]|nr:phage major capsid protein [Clostridia bacterium]